MSAQLALNFAAARVARDVGIERVTESHAQWIDTAFETLKGWLATRQQVRIEQFREWFLANGGEMPAKPNAWGALSLKANKAGLLKFVEYAPAESVKTHGHPVKVYQSLVYRGCA